MIHAMVCRSVVAAGILALAGCAQDGPHPSYLGLSDLAGPSAAADRQLAEGDDVAEALRHIQSNKVLGAMAFQKVTGQDVDPDSLNRRGNE
jgi:hypothetical protein